MQTQMEQFVENSPFTNLQEYTTKNIQAMAELQRKFFNPLAPQLISS